MDIVSRLCWGLPLSTFMINYFFISLPYDAVNQTLIDILQWSTGQTLLLGNYSPTSVEKFVILPYM